LKILPYKIQQFLITYITLDNICQSPEVNGSGDSYQGNGLKKIEEFIKIASLPLLEEYFRGEFSIVFSTASLLHISQVLPYSISILPSFPPFSDFSLSFYIIRHIQNSK